MTAIPKEIVVDLDRDAAALIALWLQIYGGDPIPAQVEASSVTAMLAAAMVAQLRSEFAESANLLSEEQLSARLGRLGFGSSYPRSGSPARSLPPRDSCVREARKVNRVVV